MDEVSSRYLDPAFRYVKSQNPARVRSWDDALRDGLNCMALAHLVIRDLFGYVLPARLQALELVHDLAHFEPPQTRSACGQETSSSSAWTARA